MSFLSKISIYTQLFLLSTLPMKNVYAELFQGCKIGINECNEHGIDPYATGIAGDASGYCSNLGFHEKTCSIETQLLTAYTAVAATCTLACIGKAPGLAQTLEAACYYGSTAASVSEWLATQWIKDSAEEYSLYLVDKKKGQFTAANWFAAANALGSGFLAFGNSIGYLSAITGKGKDAAGKIAPESGKKWLENIKSSCAVAAMNYGAASMKLANRKRIVDSALNNLENASKIWPADAYLPFASNAYMAPDATGTSSPPPVADVRTPGIEVPFSNATPSLSRLAESYATAGTKGYFANPSPNEFLKSMNSLGEALGMTPSQLIDTVNSGGPSALMDKALSKSSAEGADAMSRVFAGMNTKLNTSNVAFENTGGGNSSRKPSSDPLSSLFGSKSSGQALGGTGPKDIKFSGFNGDIWHAGSNLSIFEIVSKKTQDVTNRVHK